MAEHRINYSACVHMAHAAQKLLTACTPEPIKKRSLGGAFLPTTMEPLHNIACGSNVGC